MKMTQKEVVGLTLKFLKDNKDVEVGRSKLAEEFTEDLIEQLIEDGHSNPHRQLQTWKLNHPDFIRKIESNLRKQSILTVLSDYVMNIKQWDENKDAEYPIHKTDKEYRRQNKGSEVSLVLDGEEYNEDVNTSGWNLSYESDFNKVNSVEEALFSDNDGSTVEGLREIIQQVKDNPEPFVKKYANHDRQWNEKKVTLTRTPTRVIWTIKKLDESRVIACRVCGNAFYRHDLRNEICDVIPYQKNPSQSICQHANSLEYDRNFKKSTI